MAKNIRWSLKSADTFEEICNFIGKDSECYASMFAKKINSIYNISIKCLCCRD